MAKEALARIKINDTLKKAGWRFFDEPSGKANVVLELHTRASLKDWEGLGPDFEKTKSGFVDFLLLDDQNFPLVVLEAKREEKNPLDGKEQARRYAQRLNVRFVLLSNGNLHYFWDTETGNPQIITTFPTQESLLLHKSFKPNPDLLVKEPMERDYIILTQKPDYQSDPRWRDESQQAAFLKDNGLRMLRDYQLRAVQKVQKTVGQGKSRFLLEMATGTGKTLVAAAVIKLFLRTHNARRILFLVDRIELENQAYKAFKNYLKIDYQTVIYKQTKDDWKKAEIVVTTIQSLLVNNKYRDLFSPTDFDLVVSDEAHRSIGGNSRAVFEYFIGYKLGLTATPKDYLKNIKKIGDFDPREVERRILLDTYKTFGCDSGEPTFRYSLLDGVRDKWLINPIVIDARTEITTQLLSEKGYAVPVIDDDGNEGEEIFTHRDFERRFLSDETNRIFCQTFLQHALKDPLTGEIGKTLIFCVSQNHAAKITQLLNKMAHALYPNKYNSDFALQVTSRIQDAQTFTMNFANNNLNGHTRFNDEVPGYGSAKTRVCVTVGMMTTGYDCEDILNLCMMRPIFSPQDFVQIKGRGTRKFEFTYRRKLPDGSSEEIKTPKERFKLFDFFANCEYFEKKFPYDQVIQLPAITKPGIPPIGPQPPGLPDYTNVNPDPIKTLEETPIGLQGMRVDRELFGRFEERIKEDQFVSQKVAEGDFPAAEMYILQEIFNKPEEYFNLDKLRKSVSVDRRLSLREILEKIFGYIPFFKSKDQLLEEECDKFVSIFNPTPSEAMAIKNILRSYITDTDLRGIMETKHFAKLATHPAFGDFEQLDPRWRKVIPEYVKDYVGLNKFI
ncbi:MAG: DEAD/DEAH box helicase family protein [Phycisphaerae bacterium]